MAPDRSLSTILECHLVVLPPDKDQVEQVREEGLELLCEAERQRYQALSHPLAARRFLLGRCLLRRGLAQHLGANPKELQFSLQKNGKPVLCTPEVEGLSFNLSHSGEEAVLAIARCDALGVDLELLSRGAAVLRIAERFFSPAERQQISSRMEGPESAALRLWVLKESVIKAVGDSIWDALKSVSPDISGPNLAWLLPPPAGGAENWALMVGPFRQRYVLALALRSAGGWDGITIRFRSHVLGQGEVEGPIFCPEVKTRHPITRPSGI